MLPGEFQTIWNDTILTVNFVTIDRSTYDANRFSLTLPDVRSIIDCVVQCATWKLFIFVYHLVKSTCVLGRRAKNGKACGERVVLEKDSAWKMMSREVS
jgi:hypothetical protein